MHWNEPNALYIAIDMVDYGFIVYGCNDDFISTHAFNELCYRDVADSKIDANIHFHSFQYIYNEITASRRMPILLLVVCLFVWLVLPLCFFLCTSKTPHFVVFQLVCCGHFFFLNLNVYYYYLQIDATE